VVHVDIQTGTAQPSQGRRNF